MFLYKSLFAMFYKIGEGQWPLAFDADAHKGVVGVTIIESLLLLSVANIIQESIKFRFLINPAVIFVIFFILVFINYYALLIRRIGLNFLEKFDSDSEKDRAISSGSAIAASLIVFVLFLYSAKILRAGI